MFNRNSSSMFGMGNAPCKGCTDRPQNCHSTCEKYLTWKNEREKRRAEWEAYKEKELAYGERYAKKLKRLGFDSHGRPLK